MLLPFESPIIKPFRRALRAYFVRNYSHLHIPRRDDIVNDQMPPQNTPYVSTFEKSMICSADTLCEREMNLPHARTRGAPLHAQRVLCATAKRLRMEMHKPKSASAAPLDVYVCVFVRGDNGRATLGCPRGQACGELNMHLSIVCTKGSVSTSLFTPPLCY